VIVSLYKGRLLQLTVHRDWLSRAVTHVRVLKAIFYELCLLPLGYVGGE